MHLSSSSKVKTCVLEDPLRIGVPSVEGFPDLIHAVDAHIAGN
jgi:hypothetical protein